MLLDKIEMILAAECHLQREDKCLVGVSGGADSLCLLHALQTLGYSLKAVHVNHHLRAEADQEAQAVERLARDLEVDFTVCQVDVVRYAEEHSFSIEEAARTLRYQCLFDEAEKSRAKAVLVAHNADDQVETILLHLLRGSGLNGLRGMECVSLPNAWSERVPVMRPLISTTREEILAYLADHQLSFITDPSNSDRSYLRNRVRHELLPYLEDYNPRIRENLLRMGQINREDYAVIQDIVNTAWRANFIKDGPGYLAFHLLGFQKSPSAIQHYLLRRAVAYHLPSLRDIDFDSIQRGTRFLCDESANGQIDLIAGLRLLKEGDTFWLATWQADLPGIDFPAISPGTCLELRIPSSLLLEDAWLLQAMEELDCEQAVQQSECNSDPFQAWFDLDGLEQPLLIRSREAGDRLETLGMHGHSMKISDLMINLKIPRRGRSKWPLVISGKTIIWVPGCRQGELGRVEPGSRHIAHLTLCRNLST